jgi:hypothetical protein
VLQPTAPPPSHVVWEVNFGDIFKSDSARSRS